VAGLLQELRAAARRRGLYRGAADPDGEHLVVPAARASSGDAAAGAAPRGGGDEDSGGSGGADWHGGRRTGALGANQRRCGALICSWAGAAGDSGAAPQPRATAANAASCPPLRGGSDPDAAALAGPPPESPDQHLLLKAPCEAQAAGAQAPTIAAVEAA
jgi:hypothetical protein